MENNNLTQIQGRTFVSRSAIIEHFVCPYKHYLTYWAAATGFHPNRHSLDLLIGSVVHRGLQHLFEHCRTEHPDGNFEESCIDGAVEVARELWQKELAKKPLALKYSAEYDRLDWIIAEQECLWEGLIRAFAIYKLPGILEQYDILEVEHEEVFEGFSPYITFLGKADGLFLSKAEKHLVVLSIKTGSQYAEVTTRDIMHDMQGVSETFLTQERLERWWRFVHEHDKAPEGCNDMMFNYLYHCCEKPPKVFGVKYEYLIKGQRREEPQGSGEYRQQSFLCHPMKFDAIRKIFLGKGGSSINPAEYKWKWKAGKQPKGWNKTDIWMDVGIKDWITLLATGQIQPEYGHPFDNILHSPDLIVRSEDELKEWLVSTRFIAERIRQYIELMNLEVRNLAESQDAVEIEAEAFYEDKLQEMLWQFFPKNTLSCHDFYGHDCQFVRHCHELESMQDLIDGDEMVVRTPHHEAEIEYFVTKGYMEEDD